MPQADFCFYSTLNYFLPNSKRDKVFVHFFEGRVSIKDAIESLGVPHTEVNLILVNDRPVDFSYLLQDGDRINVYPVSESMITTGSVQPQSLPIPRFVLDIHLGKLATSLRMLGFDTLYRNDYADEELAKVSSTEGRILLTRDLGVLKRSIVSHGYYVRATDPQQQLAEILQRFNLLPIVSPFQRCLKCNGLLELVAKESIIDRLPPKTKENYHEFRRCQSCGQIFWKGTHYQRMLEFIEQVCKIPIDNSQPTGLKKAGYNDSKNEGI